LPMWMQIIHQWLSRLNFVNASNILHSSHYTQAMVSRVGKGVCGSHMTLSLVHSHSFNMVF
jgi:hypothetical protein